MSSAHSIHLFERAEEYGESRAVICPQGDFTYADLLKLSEQIAHALLAAAGKADLAEAPVAFLTLPDIHYVACQWGIWRAGGIAVPMCVKHPRPELEYVLEDTGARIVLADAAHMERLRPIALEKSLTLLSPEAILSSAKHERDRESEREDEREGELPAVDENRRAMILYTSGTTSRPKGVVSTHANIRYQTETLMQAWEWEAADGTLNVLPLHHAHGILNVLTCCLRAGAVLEMAPGFQVEHVWSRLASGELTVFMAVPTIYVKLIAAYKELNPDEAKRAARALRAMRLLVSGSAALPVQVLEQWREISGHVLLERYGMTELGMALSNPYRGERRPGFVGAPLPGVELRLVKEDGSPAEGDEPGEIQVRGPGVFLEYWRRPEATTAAFRDGWFLTGDIARRVNSSIQIMGRNSVDIIKSGGYKISALEIEAVLRDHPGVAECAVVGLPHAEWGELIAAAIAPRDNPPSSPASPAPDFRAALLSHAQANLASYKVPRLWLSLPDLPRNIMGKVLKKELSNLFHPQNPD